MAHANPAIHIVQPAASAHSSAEKNRWMGKPRFHFEPQEVMLRLRERIIGQEKYGENLSQFWPYIF